MNRIRTNGENAFPGERTEHAKVRKCEGTLRGFFQRHERGGSLYKVV